MFNFFRRCVCRFTKGCITFFKGGGRQCENAISRKCLKCAPYQMHAL